MSRYGYFGMDESYSDVNSTLIKATCPHCNRRIIIDIEQAEYKNGRWEHDDLCSELPDEIKPSDRFTRPHEWN